jgi:hypothetical protein
MTQFYIIAVLIILIIWGIARIVRWWNLPEVAAARTERIRIRRENGIFGRRKKPVVVPPAPSPEPIPIKDPTVPSKPRRRVFPRRRR